MKRIMIGALGAASMATGVAATVLYMGWVDVAADTPHSDAVYRLMLFAREQSIARRAREVTPPAGLADAARIRRGAGNYDAMCVGCHLAPGADDSEIRRGLYPQPPNLARAADAGADANRAAARRFWIIKHGIMASGMPAWANGGMEDAAIWDLTAFLGVLPTLTAEQYRQQVEASEGHSHRGLDHMHTHEEAAESRSPATSVSPPPR